MVPVAAKRKRKTKPRRKIYIQRIHPSCYRAGKLCTKVNEKQSSLRYRISKTPREDARFCLGRARIGGDPKILYFAVAQLQRNPHFKGTGYATGGGMHLRYLWKKVYDKRTEKPFKFFGDGKKQFLRGKLFEQMARASLT